MKLAIIGGGAMGEAIIASVLKAGVATPDTIGVADVSTARLAYLESTYGVATTTDNAASATDRDLVVLAIKPQELDKVAPALAASLGRAVPVSIMAGVTIERLQHGLGTEAVVRSMPNTPAQLGQVTSPGGTTAEALRALEAGGLRTAVLEAVIACYNKSRALGGGTAR